MTPDLTLNFQLRWEYHSVPTEENGLALLPRGGVAGVLDPNAVIDFAGEGTGRNFFNSDHNNFAPGFGLAYRIRPNLVFRGGYSINYVVDNNMTVVLNALRGNDGLTQTELRTALSGTVGGGLAPIPTPEFKVPRTARDQIDSDPTAALFTIDENLKTPYVQQWNVGLQFEPFRDTAFEVRYVGNRGSQLTRAIDLNQVKFPQNFVDDFRRAQNNLLQNGNPFIGEPLTVFPQLGLAGFLQAGFVQNWIANGEIGTYVGAFMVPNRAFFFAGEGGERFGATLGISPFLNNPNIFVADFVGNNAFSKYNGLQFEVRRRFHEGIAGQFNYTFGKVLTNFAGTQSGFRGYFDNAQQNLEVMRPEYDITHTLNANFVWDLPVGQGRRYLNQGGIVDAILGGWQTSGIVRVRSGETVNIVSQRGTINRDGSRATTNTVNLNGLNIGELQSRTGPFANRMEASISLTRLCAGRTDAGIRTSSGTRDSSRPERLASLRSADPGTATSTWGCGSNSDSHSRKTPSSSSVSTSSTCSTEPTSSSGPHPLPEAF